MSDNRPANHPPSDRADREFEEGGTMPKSTLSVFLLLVSCVSAIAQQPPRGAGAPATATTQTGTLRQIIPGHYVYSSATYNSGIIVTNDGVVVLDALNTEAVARAQREAIANTIKQPVRVLVSSTFHDNYSKGNIAYADVLKIGTEDYRTDLLALMQRQKVPAEEQAARLPDQTFRDRLTLYRGGKEIQILFVGRAHTRGDSIIFVPQDRIVYLSELYFADQFLFINDGYGVDWLRALDAVEALGADIFVPGHGPVPADPKETRQGLRRFRQMLVDVRDAVQKEVARGATEEQAVAAIKWPQYEKLQGYDAQREIAVRRLYQQLTGKLK
jgi:glyoxylase-like metal-dependent hydrolase (beta-lactamase superfamily II)